MAKVYDPLGLVPSLMLEGKLIYREICNQKLAWDALLPDVYANRWKNWEHKLPNSVTLPRSLATYQEPIKEIKLQAFGDASGHGVSAAIYAVIVQESGVTQGLVAAKSRLAKQGLIIPHLEYYCSLTRAAFLELLPSLETGEFIKSLKRLIARRGRSTKIYSDNGRTLIAAANWLKRVCKDERLNIFLGTREITWQFYLSRAPWWGGQFERLIGVMKGAFYKTVGQGQLSWEELSEVLLDVEIVLNNHLLSYVEDNIQLPMLTPNALLFTKSNFLPELQPYHLKEKDLRKRAKFLQRSKDAIWCRWSSEYLRALRERHRLKYGNSKNPLSVGDVVILKSEERNRNYWPLGIIEKLIVGPLNPTAPPFRPRRDAAASAGLRIQDIANDDQ